MPLYDYKHCETFEIMKPMSESGREEICPVCGKVAQRIFSPPVDYWGWILTEASHHKGFPDRWVQNRPSNDMIVDNTKAHYEKTVF